MNTSPSRTHPATMALGIAIASALTGPTNGALAQEAHQTPAQMVDALHSAFGQHHARAVHAKGIILEGQFTPSGEASTRSIAPLFAAQTVPVTVRFSDFTGIPDIPDTVGGANPRGFAVKFQMPDGSETDIVAHGFNGFPTRTSDEFAQLLRAIGASGPEASKPTALDAFLETHPIAKTFLTTQKPAPVSYSTLAYFGVNAFAFTNARQQRSVVRYRFIPKSGEQFLSEADLKNKGPNYLQEEIVSRVAKGPMAFDWYAQVAGPGDLADDPSIAWPESRRQVLLGTISITRIAGDTAIKDKALVFMPGRIQAGMEAVDPMLAVRNGAYPISFGARQ